MADRGKLSGERWNQIHDAIVEGYLDLRKRYIDELMSSGYPPGTVPLSPFERYQKLLAMRAADDPNYTMNPKAEAQLAQLALRFGTPPPMQTPFGQSLPAAPAAMEHAQYVANTAPGPGV